ncbi:MAG TPA: LacI family DNA-binding transcriptional regulator [Ktedonobacteraceae bacterium]|nr:LacI family DNA-binding transcriptional regulator [Ktedonobacteraceae bacterium]
MPGKRLTISDIARLAGVSKATVSRVLNQKPDVDPVTRERILRLVEERGFVKSATAAGLAGGRSNMFGMLVRSHTWLFVLEIMRAVSDIVDETSYELILYRMNDEFPEHDRSHAINRLLATNVASGLLAIFPGPSCEHLAPLSEQGFPLVVIDDEYLLNEKSWTGEPIPWLTVNHRTGAYAATRHLIDHGHRRIAHIQGTMSYLCARERYQGYCQALEDAGLPLDPALVVEGDFLVDGGRAAAHTLFSLPLKQRPTAIFASSDLMAYGVLATASEYGIDIPKDVALIGFDNLAEASKDLMSLVQVHPPLTSVAQPFYDMGRYATELLLALLETQYAPEYRQNGWPLPLDLLSPSIGGTYQEIGGLTRLLFPTHLVIRTTCGCVR